MAYTCKHVYPRPLYFNLWSQLIHSPLLFQKTKGEVEAIMVGRMGSLTYSAMNSSNFKVQPWIFSNALIFRYPFALTLYKLVPQSPPFLSTMNAAFEFNRPPLHSHSLTPLLNTSLTSLLSLPLSLNSPSHRLK